MLQRMTGVWTLVCVVLGCSATVVAQQPAAPAQQAAAVAEPEAPRVVLQAEQTAPVLRLMKFSGALKDRLGNARTGVVGLTFALYKEQQGGSPLWLEVHNALLDEQGRYTVLLGSTKSEGLPLELFSTGEARWLGVQVNLPGEEEQARVLLVSVPYALKAADAETLGGKPPSAFLLADPVGADPRVRPEPGKEAVKEGPGREQVMGTITGEGTTNMVSKFTGANTIGDGSLFDNGFVGVGNTNPFGKLTVTHPLSGSVTKALLLESHYDLNSGAKIVFDSLSNNGERASLGYSIASGGGGHLFFHTSQQGGFPAAERMRITNTGSVGIGSSNPFGKLTVTHPVSASVTKGLLLESHYDLNSGTKIVFDSLSNNGERASIGYSIVSAGGGDIFFNTSPQGGFPVSERMRITSAGNVGIGTATPIEKLTVAGNVTVAGSAAVGGSGFFVTDLHVGTIPTPAFAGNNSLYVQNNAGDAKNSFRIDAATNTLFVIGSSAAGAAAGAGITFRTGTAGAGEFDRMTIADNGNVNLFGGGLTAGDATFTTLGVSGGSILGSLAVNGSLTVSGGAGISGNLNVGGTLTKFAGSFRIDHPLDPANKFLSHSFVESPDMMNVYNGNARLDAHGEAWVELPEWFEALNRDFRYQLTAIGAPGPNLYIAQEVSGNRFKIAGGRPASRVSWQVTGIRRDAYANAYRIQVEEEKPLPQRGSYLHPELFGQPKEKGFESAPHPMKAAEEK